MNKLTCEMCASTDIVKIDGMYVCQSCGTKYSVEDAKRMMIEGTVDVQGTVKVDNSAFVQKYLANARRALDKTDWEEAEKYYNKVEENVPDNIEALFFSAYSKFRTRVSNLHQDSTNLLDVLLKSMSVISDYFDTTNEDKENVLKKIDQYVKALGTEKCARGVDAFGYPCPAYLKQSIYNQIVEAFETELQQISEKHDDQYIKDLLSGLEKKGCYVATAVYGSYDCPQVWTLRRYRDNVLAETWYGRAFIHTYYAISPTLVKWFGDTDWFKNMWKPKLDKWVEKLNSEGFENTPYNDRNW